LVLQDVDRLEWVQLGAFRQQAQDAILLDVREGQKWRRFSKRYTGRCARKLAIDQQVEVTKAIRKLYS
jgi:hypothetical protein